MHLHGNKDSLVYWLEFKNDDELPDTFGSIAGGSALKFGIYRRRETSAWMTGHPFAQTELSVDEAVAVAERHRDQLVAASRILTDLPQAAADGDYATLQRRLDDAAPDICDTAWGHKYLSLLHPDKVDTFHSDAYQRFNLACMLQVPPETKGRFAPAGRFVAAAAELRMPMCHLGLVLNRANGRPYGVWRIGTRVTVDGQSGVSVWTSMRDSGMAAIGWDDLGDLAWVERKKESKDKLKQLMGETYTGTAANVSSRKAVGKRRHQARPSDRVTLRRTCRRPTVCRLPAWWFRSRSSQWGTSWAPSWAANWRTAYRTDCSHLPPPCTASQ
jgi:5-methylcytosine-specific restriction protein B